MKWKLTVTANYSDDTEVNDLEIDDAVDTDEIGAAACEVASEHRPTAPDNEVEITSIVIVAVPVEA